MSVEVPRVSWAVHLRRALLPEVQTSKDGFQVKSVVHYAQADAFLANLERHEWLGVTMERAITAKQEHN